MTTSIMLVTYNRLSLTQRMLSNLFATTKSPYRLIIVDNGSTDGTVDWLKTLKVPELCQTYDTYFNSNNRGIAIGRNQGLLIANKYNDEWLSTLDNDVELPDNWLSECIDIMQANPNLALGVNMEGTNYPLVTRNEKTFQLKSAGNLGTACTVFPRKLHNKIGYFITEYELYGEEDANYFFRARMVGWELGYITTPGDHFGVGELDTGKYRKFKDECRVKNIGNFRKHCSEYISGKRHYYILFNEKL